MMRRYGRILTVACVAGAIFSAGGAAAATKLEGTLQRWHRVTLTFDGPGSSETASKNPFTDYRLLVTFTSGAHKLVVPGFYAADGDAADTSASSGNKWRVHLSPPAAGSWSWVASFRTGSKVATATSASAGTATSFDGAKGSFSIKASTKTGRDHRGQGLLRLPAGSRYLRFSGSGDYFIKGGADSPENFLAYHEFDQTPGTHKYAPHVKDYKAGDPSWKGGKGKGILGALNYLAGKGMNSVYFLTMNVTGDSKDVWPWTSSSERNRFDVSKLAQWEVVFSQMDRLGLMLHVITQETENDQLLNGGALGDLRKLYYRELIARFSHHLALVWNLGEENTNTDAQRAAFAAYFKAHDPYGHPVVVHTYPNQYDKVYKPLLGNKDFDGPSLQMGDMKKTHAETLNWVKQSAASTKRWFVSLDEIGPANTGVKADVNDPAHDDVRKHALWGNLMAGGAGAEWYFGYQQPHTDLNCEDWRSRDKMWDQTRFALEFFTKQLPFEAMTPDDGLVSAAGAWCLANKGEVYAVYLPDGGSTKLTLGPGTYTVAWYDPRKGGAMQSGSVTSLTGPGDKSVGDPPGSKTKDWALLVRKQGAPGEDAGPKADVGGGGDSSTPPAEAGSADSGGGAGDGAAADSSGAGDGPTVGSEDDGCSCRLGAEQGGAGSMLLVLLVGLLLVWRRRQNPTR